MVEEENIITPEEFHDIEKREKEKEEKKMKKKIYHSLEAEMQKKNLWWI